MAMVTSIVSRGRSRIFKGFQVIPTEPAGSKWLTPNGSFLCFHKFPLFFKMTLTPQHSKSCLKAFPKDLHDSQ